MGFTVYLNHDFCKDSRSLITLSQNFPEPEPICRVRCEKNQSNKKNTKQGRGFKHFLLSSLFGEDSHFDYYFSDGLVQPPTRKRAAIFCEKKSSFFFVDPLIKLKLRLGFNGVQAQELMIAYGCSFTGAGCCANTPAAFTNLTIVQSRTSFQDVDKARGPT